MGEKDKDQKLEIELDDCYITNVTVKDSKGRVREYTAEEGDSVAVYTLHSTDIEDKISTEQKGEVMFYTKQHALLTAFTILDHIKERLGGEMSHAEVCALVLAEAFSCGRLSVDEVISDMGKLHKH